MNSINRQRMAILENKNLDLSYDLYQAEELLKKIIEQKETDNDFDELYWKIKNFLKEK